MQRSEIQEKPNNKTRVSLRYTQATFRRSHRGRANYTWRDCPLNLPKITRYKHSILSLLIILKTQTAWTAGDTTTTLMPHLGRFMLSAAGAGVNTAAGSGIGIFGGDVMQPVYGNDNGFLFTDFMGDGATGNTFLVSPGLGIRQVIKNQIWGAYLFGDNEKVSLGQNFWNISPGIEWMTPHWGVHANGYFPIPQTQVMGDTVFADNLGNYDYVYFVNGTHNQYDALTAPYDVIGNGGDVELAYRFSFHDNLASRAYVGGYYYQPSTASNFTNITHVKNIPGITAGFEQSLNKNLRLSLMNSYDSVNFYTIGVRLQLTLGDDSTIYSDNVHDRLLEPIERHVGIIATGAGTYDQLGYQNLGNALEYNNVFFMAPNGAGNGTYGNPMALSQTSLDTINTQSPNSSRLYFQGGGGAVYAVNSTNTLTKQGLQLYNGQDLYGRTANYTAPATSAERPVISINGDTAGVGVDNGFYIQSGENTFSDLAITASSTNGTTTGIYVITTTEATINVENTSVTGLSRGLYAENNGTDNLTINANNSSFSNNTANPAPGDTFNASGIYASNIAAGTLTINATNSSFNGNMITGIAGDNGNTASGIYANNTGAGSLLINAINSSFNGHANSSSNNNTGASGINAFNTAAGNLTINTTRSTFNGNTNTGTGTAVAGISASNTTTGNLTINATDSQFNQNSSTNAQVNGLYIIDNGGHVNLNLSNSSFNGNTITGPNNGSADGVFINAVNLNMNVTNSTFNGNVSDSKNVGGGFANGLEAVVSGTATITVINSQFNGNQALNAGGGFQAAGLLVFDTVTANTQVSISGSQFNNNLVTGDGANGGATGFNIYHTSSNTMSIVVTNSQFNGSSASGNGNAGAAGLYAATGVMSRRI